MTEEVFKLMKCFPHSMINANQELILSFEGNVYINTTDCVDAFDLKMKLLHWCSRPIAKGMFYQNEKRNTSYREQLLRCMNEYMQTDFSLEDMEVIYQKLGNGINPRLTNLFISNDYDMTLLN